MILTAQQMAGAWLAAGGPKVRMVAWLAISMGESSWNTEAVSPTDARGLYQLEPYSWPPAAGPLADWTDPVANSTAAVLLSGGGANFAPWDTAYANIEASGRYQFLNWPEQGSAAWNNMPQVAAQLGGHLAATMAPAAEPGLTGTLPAAIAWYNQASGVVLPQMSKTAARLGQRARRMY